MTRLFALIASVPLITVSCGTAASIADESMEPPLNYTVKVGEKTMTISEGESVQFDGTFTNPNVTVTPHSYRVFPYQGITFKYPRSFTFEADLVDPTAKTWTLSGNDFKIMYFVLNDALSAADFAKDMINQFGRENAKVVDANATITLGEQQLNGTSFRVTVATHKMVMDIYRLPSRGTQTRLLVFQDSLDDSGNRSKEGQTTIAEVKSSFAMER